MKTKRDTNLVLAGVLSTAVAVAFSPSTIAGVINDGGSHTFDSTINDYIEVYAGPGNAPTTVTFNTGANLTGRNGWFETLFLDQAAVGVINDGTFAYDVALDRDATLTMNGGTLNDDLLIYKGSAIINDGYIANTTQVYLDSRLDVFGGDFGSYFFVGEDAVVNFYDGVIGDDIKTINGGTVFMSGGSVGNDIEVNDGGLIDISGGILAADGLGSLDVGLAANNDGRIILRGMDFLINGLPALDGLVSPLTGTISGTLADGTAFSDIPFDQNPLGNRGFIELVVVPEPASLAMMGLGTVCLFSRRRRKSSR